MDRESVPSKGKQELSSRPEPGNGRELSKHTSPAATFLVGAGSLLAMAMSGTSAVGQAAPRPISPQDAVQNGNAQALCTPQVIGNRRIPKESVLARLFSRQGNLYDPLIVERDFNSLWNTGYFEDVRIERQDTPACVQLIIYVREKPTIREIHYQGLNAVSESDVLERFKKEKVGLSVESQYDPTRIKRAEVVLVALLA